MDEKIKNSLKIRLPEHYVVKNTESVSSDKPPVTLDDITQMVAKTQMERMVKMLSEPNVFLTHLYSNGYKDPVPPVLTIWQKIRVFFSIASTRMHNAWLALNGADIGEDW